MSRFISIITKEQGQHVSIEKQVKGLLTPNERALIEKAATYFLSLPITIIDKPALNMTQIKRLAKKEQLNNGEIGLIIGDYLGQIKPDKQMENFSQSSLATAIVNEWATLSKELNTASLLLHQLSRSLVNRADKTPVLADLREGGEEPANKAILLHDDSYYDPSIPPGVAKAIVGKNRQGETGPPIPFIYDRSTGVIGDATTKVTPLNGGGFQ